MKEREIEAILRLCFHLTRPIPVYQAKCAKDRYELEFEEVRS